MYITAIKGIQVPLTLYAGPFPLWIGFFVLGVALAGSGRNFCWAILLIGLVVTLLLQFFECKWLLTHFLQGVGLGIKPSSFLFSVLVILLVFSKRVEESFKSKKTFNKAISFVGRVSFVVYLSHTLVIIVLYRVPLYNNFSWGGRFLIVTIADMALVGMMYCLTPLKMKRVVGF